MKSTPDTTGTPDSDMMETLREILRHTEPDNEGSYRADDPEGCLDTVHALAKAAIAKGTNA